MNAHKECGYYGPAYREELRANGRDTTSVKGLNSPHALLRATGANGARGVVSRVTPGAPAHGF
jgi:hypothetical protein